MRTWRADYLPDVRARVLGASASVSALGPSSAPRAIPVSMRFDAVPAATAWEAWAYDSVWAWVAVLNAWLDQVWGIATDINVSSL